MDLRILEKEAFTVVGKSRQVNCLNGEHPQRISEFWAESHQDGTLEELVRIGTTGELFGVCVDMQPDQGVLTYMIACEADRALDESRFTSFTIPAATWAVFTSTGPLPGAIQQAFGYAFQEWLPASEYRHAPAPDLEVYPSGDTMAADYRCEVWIPIVKK
ncbi:GyrI-like domain-containing protein [Brevibacillus reuszeri]|uniref:GyrI-like domain-containing protein n=1 Tax=Brevibacillus reuszeri TaxID=54915 RepID=UPI0028A0631C|nr:GyrI-like domain-containing protein [Brevibacillus reuszeri]